MNLLSYNGFKNFVINFAEIYGIEIEDINVDFIIDILDVTLTILGFKINTNIANSSLFRTSNPSNKKIIEGVLDIHKKSGTDNNLQYRVNGVNIYFFNNTRNATFP